MKEGFMMEKIILIITVVLIIHTASISAVAENIDPYEDDSQYGWGENIGWINFEPDVAGPNPGAQVSGDKLTGLIWAENIGWINLSPTTYGGILNDGNGNLSGYAWGENVGWINFDPEVTGDANDYGVKIDSEGNFSGWAWGENIGWINFNDTDLFGYAPVVCVVNFDDLANLADDWLASGSSLPGDLDKSGEIEFSDYGMLAEKYRDFCPEGWKLK
jgi:hypothetical protein